MGLTDRTDDELALAAIEGDWGSFMELCRRHYRAMVSIAHAVLGDGHLAQDAAQEAFAKACQRIGSLKDPKRFGAWLACICRNEAITLLRRNPRVERLGERDVPAQAFDDEDDVDEVRQILSQMPGETRELLYLRYCDDWGYEAIAKLLETSAEAVHGRLTRAKQEVKRRLEQSRRSS